MATMSSTPVDEAQRYFDEIEQILGIDNFYPPFITQFETDSFVNALRSGDLGVTGIPGDIFSNYVLPEDKAKLDDVLEKVNKGSVEYKAFIGLLIKALKTGGVQAGGVREGEEEGPNTKIIDEIPYTEVTELPTEMGNGKVHLKKSNVPPNKILAFHLPPFTSRSQFLTTLCDLAKIMPKLHSGYGIRIYFNEEDLVKGKVYGSGMAGGNVLVGGELNSQEFINLLTEYNDATQEINKILKQKSYSDNEYRKILNLNKVLRKIFYGKPKKNKAKDLLYNKDLKYNEIYNQLLQYESTILTSINNYEKEKQDSVVKSVNNYEKEKTALFKELGSRDVNECHKNMLLEIKKTSDGKPKGHLFASVLFELSKMDNIEICKVSGTRLNDSLVKKHAQITGIIPKLYNKYEVPKESSGLFGAIGDFVSNIFSAPVQVQAGGNQNITEADYLEMKSKYQTAKLQLLNNM